MKKAILLVVLALCLPALLFAGGTKEAAGKEASMAGGPRTVAPRQDAPKAEPITPKDFPKAFLPGIESVGAVPLKKYKIAISNGDMGNLWRRTFWEDMEAYAKQYKDRFGLEIITANALTAVVDLCEQNGIPLITVDRGLDRPSGEGKYISMIQIDGYRSGIANGVAVVEWLTKKYGAPKGKVAEIPGILGASAAITLSQGIRRVLREYPDIKIVSVRPGEYDRQKSFKAAQDILTVNKKGELDAILAASEDSALAALEAIRSAGREELVGWIFSVDASIEVLEHCLAGDIAQVSEEPPYFGMMTFEYAIHYLNGEDIPALVPLAQRSFSAETPEKKAKLKAVIDEGKKLEIVFAPASAGGFDLFRIPADMQARFYPKPYWDQPASYLKEIEPYTESK
jgi:ABC-type sugar transport system substrate-binding protein